jgi:3-oxoacyl-[acyl-carrier protein] reductase
MLKGQRALVTGGSQGLGLAIARKLAQLGCSITLVSRNESKLKANIADFPSDARHDYLVMDLQRPNFTQLASSLQAKTILVNCAGISTHSLLPRLSDEQIAATINLNLTTPIILSKLSYKHMLKNNHDFVPTILNIASVLSYTKITMPGTLVYAALKAGLLGFTQSLAAELKNKVRVNALLPGLISETEMGAAVKMPIKSVGLDECAEQAVAMIVDQKLSGKCIALDAKGKREV